MQRGGTEDPRLEICPELRVWTVTQRTRNVCEQHPVQLQWYWPEGKKRRKILIINKTRRVWVLIWGCDVYMSFRLWVGKNTQGKKKHKTKAPPPSTQKQQTQLLDLNQVIELNIVFWSNTTPNTPTHNTEPNTWVQKHQPKPQWHKHTLWPSLCNSVQMFSGVLSHGVQQLLLV